jgi:pimeloyl-ACP methyl ester carboxylesterase
MARPILMPQVGQDLTEGKIVAIHVKLGDKVKKGDIVAEVESEKATFEVEAFETGTVIELPFKVGDTAVVLKPLMIVGDEGEVAASSNVAAAAPVGLAKATPANAETVQHKSGIAGSSPLARRLAREAGVDLTNIKGSGPEGAIVKKDLEGFRRDVSSVVARGDTGVRLLQKGIGDPVLFIHGFGADLSAWRPFILHLGINNPIYALDLPAHGANAALRASHFADLSASVLGTIKDADLKALHLVGHSVGAAIAADIAKSDAVDVLSLALISPAGLGAKINGDYIQGFLAAKSEVALKAWLELLVYNAAVLTGALLRATFAGRAETSMAVNQQRLADGLFEGSTQLFSVHDALARFSGPARVIVGKDDRIIPTDHADTVPAHVAVNRLPQVGHLPQLEAAALTARLVAETIRSAR